MTNYRHGGCRGHFDNDDHSILWRSGCSHLIIFIVVINEPPGILQSPVSAKVCNNRT